MPGPLFILLGALVWAVATDFDPVGGGRLAILAALALLTVVLGFVTGAIGARHSGASGAGVVGALLGAVVGIFFGPLGLLVGPVLGAVAGELLHGAGVEGSMRAGLGTVLGLAAGILGNFIVALMMVGLFVWWVWRA